MALRFKLDENLPRRVESALRDLEHDVETALSEGLAGALDPDLLAACTAEDRVLVTLDLDFAGYQSLSTWQPSRCLGAPATKPGVRQRAERGAGRHQTDHG